MCGIVGYVGKEQAVPVLLQGLYKLEYRGYDSAGIAVIGNDCLKLVKTKGRIKNLDDKIAQQGGMESTCGIGHTRWATHGCPSDINAHPHLSKSGRVAIVHNGIIENYLDIKQMLQSKGYEMKSQTDTEVVAHLFEMNNHGDLLQALLDTVKEVRGSYALGIVSADHPQQILCTKRDNPLIIGVGEGENMIASDIPAIIAKTKRYIVLGDNEIAKLTPEGVTVYNAYGQEIEKEIQTVDWDISSAEKGGYEHFMIKEIMEQPKAIRDTVSPRIDKLLPNLEESGLTDDIFRNIRNIHIVGCGSALHTGLVGREVIERFARVPVVATIASEFRYRQPIIGPEDLCIAISQSGETADTLAAMREAKKHGAKTIAVVNVVSSTAAREADSVLYTWAGPEIAVATTKAYSAQLSALYLIAVKAGLARGTLTVEQANHYCEQILALHDLVKEALGTQKEIQYLASKFSNKQSAFFLGRGIDFAAAQEASLKLKEISYIHSEAYAAGELKHGTISLIEEGTLVVALATDPVLYEKTLSNIKSVKARGASVILITDEEIAPDPEICDYVVKIPECDPFFSASLSIIPMQFLSYYMGIYRGCDIDKPRNLAKSVTVE